MKNPRKKRENNFLLNFYISYITVLLLPICLCLFIYLRTINIMKVDAQQSNMAMLEQIKFILDERFVEIDNAISQLSENPTVQRLQYISNPLGGTDAFKVRAAVDSLNQYVLRSSCIQDIFIYSKNSDMIVSSGSAFIRLPLYYTGSFQYGNLNYEAWHNSILQGYYHKKVFSATSTKQTNGVESSMILYIQSLPYNNYRPPITGNIIVMIKNSEIIELLSRLNIANGGWAYVADENGNVITSVASDPAKMLKVDKLSASQNGILQYDSGKEKMIVTSTKSLYNGFTYVAAYPNTVLMQNVSTVNTLLVLLMTLAICSALLLAFYMAYRNSAPYKNIFAILRSFFKDSEPKTGGYQYIQGGLTRLVENNTDLANSIERQLPMVQNAFYNKLLHGEFKSIEELNASMEQVCLHIRSHCQNVAIIRMDGYKGAINRDALKELSEAIEIIKTVVATIACPHELTYNLHSLGSRSIALIMSTEADISTAEFEEAADRMLGVLYDQLHCQHCLNVTISVGNTYDSLYDLFYSYYEALRAGECIANCKHGHIIWYRSIPKDSISYYYPIDIETRLTNLIKSGNAEGARKLIDEIYRENTIERTLSPEMSRQVIFELRGTFIKIIDQVAEHGSQISQELHGVISDLTVPESIEDMFERFQALADSVSSYVNRGKTSKKTDLMQRVLNHIDNSYQDYNLSLSSVAAHFDLSETYLCQLFKDQTGDHFSAYLTNVRLKQACTYLAGTDMPINDVAAQTGFNSAHSFRRSFKRVIGVTPLEYRDPKCEFRST
jgi:two-component system, response regulator YesN